MNTCRADGAVDGSGAVAFTDGKMIGATLDRNGLRLRAT